MKHSIFMSFLMVNMLQTFWNISSTYAKNVGRPDGEGGRDKDDDILVSFTSFGIDESFTWKTQKTLYNFSLLPQWHISTTEESSKYNFNLVITLYFQV